MKRLFFQQNSSILNLYQHFISPNSSESERLCFIHPMRIFKDYYFHSDTNPTNQTNRCNISMTHLHEIEKCAAHGSVVFPFSIAKVFCEFPEDNLFDTITEARYTKNISNCWNVIDAKLKNLESRFFIQLDEAETDRQICFSFKYYLLNGFELLIAKNCPNLTNLYQQILNNFLTMLTNISENYLTKSCPDLYVNEF